MKRTEGYLSLDSMEATIAKKRINCHLKSFGGVVR